MTEKLRRLTLEEQAIIASDRVIKGKIPPQPLFEAMMALTTHDIQIPDVPQKQAPLSVPDVPQDVGEATWRHRILAEYLKAGYPYEVFCELFGPTP